MQDMIRDAKKIAHDSIAAVLPDAAVRRALDGRRFARPVRIVAIGKASWRLADSACRTLGEQVSCGVVIT